MESINANGISQMLASHDIVPTRQRLDIAKLLLAKPQHLSADQVLDAVNSSHSKVSKATVYNTLGLFARKGLIREVIVDSSKVFYDSTTAPHYHVYNVDTGLLTDVDSGSLKIGVLPEPPAGTTISGVDIVIRVRSTNQDGLSPLCSE